MKCSCGIKSHHAHCLCCDKRVWQIWQKQDGICTECSIKQVKEVEKIDKEYFDNLLKESDDEK